MLQAGVVQITEGGRELTTGDFFPGKEENCPIVLLQGGLGDADTTWKLTNKIQRRVQAVGDVSLLFLRHPFHGEHLPRGTESPDFSLDLCRRATSIAFKLILDENKSRPVVPVGYSTGAWSVTQAVAGIDDVDKKRIPCIFAKSLVLSYRAILERHLAHFDTQTDGKREESWRMGFKHFQINDETGIGVLPIMPGRSSVGIHKNFFIKAAQVEETETIGVPMQLWHGGLDTWTQPGELHQLNPGQQNSITLVNDVGHDMRPHHHTDNQILAAILQSLGLKKN